MVHRSGKRRMVMGLSLLILLGAMQSADAQRRSLPSRTKPIPDTETGGKVGTGGSAEPSEPSLMIYGPAVPPLGAPPAPPAPAAPEAKPAPVIEPAPPPVAAPIPVPPPPPVAAPAPIVEPTPAPVAKPVAPPPDPVAIPIPAPSPAPIAAPAPPPPPAPPPAPVAAPAPPPAPVAVPVPPPSPPPPPIAAPVPAPKPQPAPIAAPAPAPVAKPAPEPRAVAAIAPAPAAGPPKLDPKLVEQIFSCLAPGLPSDWKRTWVVVSNAAGAATAKFYYSVTLREDDAEELVPCNAQEITRRITGLTATLPVDQQRWTSARLLIDSEGAFALNYNYAK